MHGKVEEARLNARKAMALAYALASLVSRHLGVLSECNERARGQPSIICGYRVVIHSKRQGTRKLEKNLDFFHSCKVRFTGGEMP